MDIEHAEWDALETMLAKPSCLSNVKQLMIEFHRREMASNKSRASSSSREDLARYWQVLRGILRLGYKVWNVWNNPTCKFRSSLTSGKHYFGCFNMYFLNVKYLL